MNHRWLALLLLYPFTSLAQTEISDGDRVRIALQDVATGNAVIIPFVFDVPDNARSFTLGLTGLAGDRDVDILIRADQELDTSSFSALQASADYLSVNTPTAEESIVVQDSANPVASGRTWFMQLVVFEGTGGEVGLSLDFSSADPMPAAFILDFNNSTGLSECETAPWNDNTAFTPTGGNNATTLGQARRNAMQEAAARLALEVFSPIPVRVAACWESAGGSQTEATVANGRPAGALLNTPGLPTNDVFHAQPVVERKAGTELCNLPLQTPEACDVEDVAIRFNVDVDSPQVLGNTDWHYGLNPGGAGNDIDFVQVAIHELVHGLGFTTLMDSSGELGGGSGRSDAYVEQLVDNRNNQARPLTELTDNARSAVIKSQTGLQWRGPESAISLANDLALVGDSFLRIYAPSSFEAGSSMTHLTLDYCELMLPRSREGCDETFRSLGLARTMLHEIGWSPGPNVPPYLGQMFDPARNGHGFEFQLGGFLPDGTPLYVLTLYTYETIGGLPEWFQATGIIENGVFFGQATPMGENGLQEFTYDDSRSPPQQADPGHRGHVVLSFNQPASSAACTDGTSRDASIFAVMQWIIDDEVDEWCMIPLVPPNGIPSNPNNDFGGLWFNPDDGGWGFSIETIRNSDGSLSLFVLVFVYADDGTPVWYFGFAGGFVPGEPITMDLVQRNGFSRLTTFGGLTDTVAGTLTLTLVQPSNSLGAGNQVTIDVDYLGPEGGRWFREDLPIQRLTQPRN